MSSSELFVESGNAFVCYAFDVGAGIDLPKAERLLAGDRIKTPAHEKRRQTKYFEFTPPPLRLVEEVPVQALGPKFATLPAVEILIFDFGCLSVRFLVPLHGPIRDVVDLSVELYENGAMLEAARGVATRLFDRLRSVVDRPEMAARVEDYCIFHLSKLTPSLTPAELLRNHVLPLTGLLRAEADPPSDREAQEILNDRISYGFNDVTLVSWYSAVIYGENAEDIYAVLEFTNLVLMELSFLDSRLDKALDQFYDYFTVAHRRRPSMIFDLSSRRPAMRRIAQLQIDSAIAFERITNALKLMGDDFQARVFQLATKKLGVSSWDASLSRKLQTIESIYQKISEAEGARRMEVLELIIILLIMASIVLPLFFPTAGH